MAELFTLDKGEGYSIRLEIWPNGNELEENMCWYDQFMIHPGDFDGDKTAQTTRRMRRFLRQYKKRPIGEGVAKRKKTKERAVRVVDSAVDVK